MSTQYAMLKILIRFKMCIPSIGSSEEDALQEYSNNTVPSCSKANRELGASDEV